MSYIPSTESKNSILESIDKALNIEMLENKISKLEELKISFPEALEELKQLSDFLKINEKRQLERHLIKLNGYVAYLELLSIELNEDLEQMKTYYYLQEDNKIDFFRNTFNTKKYTRIHNECYKNHKEVDMLHFHLDNFRISHKIEDQFIESMKTVFELRNYFGSLAEYYGRFRELVRWCRSKRVSKRPEKLTYNEFLIACYLEDNLEADNNSNEVDLDSNTFTEEAEITSNDLEITSNINSKVDNNTYINKNV